MTTLVDQAMDVGREDGRRIYRMMHLIRKFEETVAACFAGGEIPGFIHLSTGQEAIPAAVCALLGRDDMVAATHRGHGACLAKGADPRLTMAELFGRRTGYCRGRGGSMHVGHLPAGILGTNGIVGANLPIAVGAALAAQIRSTRQVTACFFGDGAVNTGAAHEALNLASTWDLPVVFVCENNLYAEFTPQAAQTKATSVAERAAAYKMASQRVDGNDVLAVLAAARPAVERARNGAGPTLIEAMTYRYRGHHEGDPMGYRPKAELEAWRQKDPLPRFCAWLLERGHLTVEDDVRLTEEVAAEVAAAVEFARESPWPGPEEVLEDVYA